MSDDLVKRLRYIADAYHGNDNAGADIRRGAARIESNQREKEGLKRDLENERRSRLHDRDPLERRVAELEAWREAVIDALVVDFIYTKEHDTDPRKAIDDLIAWEQKIALDPAVSKEARDLRDTHLERAERNEQDAARWRERAHANVRGIADVQRWEAQDAAIDKARKENP